jgi:hypothetical protein
MRLDRGHVLASGASSNLPRDAWDQCHLICLICRHEARVVALALGVSVRGGDVSVGH